MRKTEQAKGGIRKPGLVISSKGNDIRTEFGFERVIRDRSLKEGDKI